MNDLKILIIDNDMDAVNTIKKSIKKWYNSSLNVQEAISEKEAFNLLIAFKPEIVILGFRLNSDINSFKMLKTIKQQFSETEVIIVIDRGEKINSNKIIDIGSYVYLMKPFQLEELRYIIEQAAEKIRTRSNFKIQRQRLMDKLYQEKEKIPREILNQTLTEMEKIDEGRVNSLAKLFEFTINLVERDQIKKRLRESRERLEQIFESMDDVVFLLDANGNFEKPLQSKRPGFYSPDYEGKHLNSASPGYVSMLIEVALISVKKNKKSSLVEYSMIIDSKPGWFSAKVSGRWDSSGKFSGATVVVREINDKEEIKSES